MCFHPTGYPPESSPTWHGCMVTKSSFSWYWRFIKIDWLKFPIVNVLGIRERNPLSKWAVKKTLMRDYSKRGVSFLTPTSCIWFHLQQTKYWTLHKYFKYNVPYSLLSLNKSLQLWMLRYRVCPVPNDKTRHVMLIKPIFPITDFRSLW